MQNKAKEYVVVNFLSQVIYIFLLFQLYQQTLPYPQTKEKQKLPEIKRLTTKSIKTCSNLCTEPWSLVLSINFLYVRHQNRSKWQLNQYHFKVNLFIVKRAGLNQNMFSLYRQKSSSNNRQFCQRGMLHIP